MYIFFFLCFFSIANIYGQKCYDTKGVVINIKGEPIKNVNIRVYDSHNKIIQHTSTSDDGLYILHLPDSFPQIVEMSHLSYNDYSLCLLNKSQLSSLKKITLSDKSTELSEVKVKGKKPDMFFRDNALVVNISNNPNYQHQLLTRVLRKLPGTEIDNKSHISLYGRGVTIYVDGVPLRAVSAKMLENIIATYPTKVIEEIELNPNSTGQFGSNPNSSYINIITKSSYHDGSFMTLNPNTMYHKDSKLNGDINGAFIFTKGRFSMNAGLSYEFDYDHNTSDVSTKRNDNIILQQNSESKDHINVYMGSVNANYRFDDGGLLSAYFDFYDDFSRHDHNENMSSFFPLKERTNFLRGRNRGNADQWVGCLRYRSNYRCKHSFLVSYSLMYGGRRKFDNSLTRDNETSPYMEYDSKMFGGIHNLSARYTYKPLKGRTFNFLVSSSYGRLKDRIVYDEDHSSLDNVMLGHETNVDFEASYNHQFNKSLGCMLDIGGKYTRYDVRNGNEEKNKFHYFNLIPYAHINYISENQNYKGMLGFRTDVIQPKYSYMLTGIRYIDDYNYSMGNKDIKSTRLYTVFLNQYFFRYIYMSLAYKKYRNMAGGVYRSENNTTTVSYCNYADQDFFSIYLQVPYRLLSKKLSGKITFNPQYHVFSNLKNGCELNAGRPTHFWNYTFDMSANYDILKNLGVYVSYTYYPNANTGIQKKRGSFSKFDCGLYWSPLKSDRISLTLDAFDIFDTYHAVQNIYYGDMSKRIYPRSETSCYVKLGIVFNFSRGKEQDKNIYNAPVDTGRF